MTRPPRLLLVAALLAGLAVGLPWSLDGGGLGTQQPVRVVAVVAALGVWAALRRGSRRAALAVVAVAAVALSLGSWDGGPQPGRVCYVLALLTAAVAIVTERSASVTPDSRGTGTVRSSRRH
jgi:peptidoglycan/LPS O-acetylase OafA/YrhL